MRKLFEKLCNIEIINWSKIDTYNSFWGGLFFTVCHPFYAWKYDRYCYGTFIWKVKNFFTETMWKYFPGSKACRWLGNMLVQRTYDSKYIDIFWANCYGSNVTYRAKCFFGYIHVYSVRGKKQVKTTIYRGIVFTKKKAFRVFREVVEANKKIYNPTGNCYPLVEDQWLMFHVDDMLDLLHNGKTKEKVYIDQTQLDLIFRNSHDNIEKLWCYITDMLCCRNDFDAHELLSEIVNKCDMYLYFRLMKKDPKIDFTYKRMLENLGQKEADKYKNEQIREYSKQKSTVRIEKAIEILKQFYINMPYGYYRI